MSSSPQPSSALASARAKPVWVAAAMVAVAVALAAGVFIGIASHGNDEAATNAVGEDSVDVGFARAMRDHHAQAVEMSVIVRDATDDPQIRTLALDILLTQQQQLGQMFGWLAMWGYPQAGGGDPMTWMGETSMGSGTDGESTGMDHGSMNSGSEASAEMPGMATTEQLQRLELAEGRSAERLFLQLMIPHHEAGVTMAEHAVENATEPQVKRLAQTIVDSQTSEIKVLQSMLRARGGPLLEP